MRLVTARRYRRALCHDANVLLFQTAAGIIMYHFISDSARFCTFSLSFCCRHGYKFERFVRPPSQFFVRCTMQVMQFPLANKKVTTQTLDGQEKRWAINGWFRWTPFLILVKLNYDTWTSARWNIPLASENLSMWRPSCEVLGRGRHQSAPNRKLITEVLFEH